LLQLDANDEDDDDENVNNLKRIKLRLASSLPESIVWQLYCPSLSFQQNSILILNVNCKF